jgi:glycosidase
LSYPADAANNKNLNTLLTLEAGKNIIHLQDYIMEPLMIDSINTNSEYIKVKLSVDKNKAEVEVDKDAKNFINIQVWVKGVPFSIPCRKDNLIDYVFTFDPKGKTYNTVQIAGQMNDWNPSATPSLTLKSSGLYQITLKLNPGTYPYQLVLDGNWAPDPNNALKMENGHGSYNSIMKVAENGEKTPLIFTHEFSDNMITLSYENKIDDIFIYWQNYKIPAIFSKMTKDKIVFDIPAEAKSVERSFIRVWASNSSGISNDLLIPLHNGKVLTDPDDLSRNDKHAQIIYFLMVDRFFNGDDENDKPVDDEAIHPKANYMGGDLAGISQKIKGNYFKNLGVNTLWISPLNQNPLKAYGFYEPAKTKFSGYHGYWPISSSRVDFRFGTNDDLKDIVELAHEKDINILLDYVANHVHEEHPVYKEHPEYATPLYLPDGTMNIEKWDECRFTTWFDTFLPTLDFDNNKLLDMMTDSALYWVKEFDIDGFRHDACKHVPENYWRMLTLKLKAYNKEKTVYQIGETYGSPQLLNSYVNSGMLDGQFDFNVFDEAYKAFAGVGNGTLSRLGNVLNTGLKMYGSHHLMGNISGNHDKARFMAFASGSLTYGEDTKLAGWTRDIEISDSVAYSKLLLLHAFNMTIPGIPVIYYGDEIGMTGANDPDCRRMMRFDGWNMHESKLWEKVSELINLRKNNPVFIYGDFISISAKDDSWIYARKYFKDEAIVIINNSGEAKYFEITIPPVLSNDKLTALFDSEFHHFGSNLKIEIPAYSVEILY